MTLYHWTQVMSAHWHFEQLEFISKGLLKYKIKALSEYYVSAQMNILQIIYGASMRHVTFPSAVRFNLSQQTIFTTKS